MIFKVGQKVACVDASNAPMLKFNSVYTVVTILFEQYGVGLKIAEASPPKFGHWVGFRAERFRPIVERKTEISIFTKMLKTEKIDA